MKRWAATIAIVLLPALTFGQSLGELAKKEKERRKKNQEQGVKARTITDEQVSTASDTPPPPPPPESSAKTASSDTTAAGAATTGASSKPPLKEEEWRYRVAEARTRVQRARERCDYLSGLSLVPGEYYVDEKGNPVISSLGQLQSMVREANAEREAAEKALADLLEEARRAGVPPGWLR